MKQAYIKVNKYYSNSLSEEHISFRVGDRIYEGYVSYADINGDLLKITVIDAVSEETVNVKLPDMYTFRKGGMLRTITIPKEMVIY